VAQYKDVELTDGRTVRVYRPPYTRIHANVRKRFPEPIRPEIPMVTAKTVTGGQSRPMPNPHDPDYLAAVERWEQAHSVWQERYNDEVDRMRALFILKDVQVPEGWEAETAVGGEMRFFDPEWEPTPGPMGCKLDYILWEILGDVVNANRITDAEAELSGISLEEVQANEASFRHQVEGETDPEVAGGSQPETGTDD
jgi:hypothetical protein